MVIQFLNLTATKSHPFGL